MIHSLGRYSIEDELGRGGMGVVYRARDTRLGKTVAVKVLSQHSTLSADSKSRFRREARAAAVLNHPSIVSVFDYDEDEGVPFIVYELVEGTRLDHLIARGRPSESQTVELAYQVASALAYAHERGIIHRDIKPQNIVVTEDGRAKILDFGLAKKTGVEFMAENDDTLQASSTFETVRGTILGTVQYMSPEQIGGKPLDGRTDIFSLGIVLYEMLTGVNPFRADSVASTIGKIMSSDNPDGLPQGSVSSSLREIVTRALCKNREDRYCSARELADDLARLKNAVSGPVSQGSASSWEASVIPRRAALVLMMLLQLLYLAIYGTALYFLGDAIGVLQEIVRDFITPDPLTGLRIARGLFTVLLVTGCCGIAVRLYLAASIAFDDPETGFQFRRIFPFIFLIDEIWALAPLLLIGKWRIGVTLLCAACLAYLPMSQRTLVRSAYLSARTGKLLSTTR